MIYRAPQEHDYPGMQGLDLELAHLDDANFDALPDRERNGRLRTSLAALRFYARSEHSFVAVSPESIDPDAPSNVYGFILAQSVWMGDKPIVWVSNARVHPDAPSGCLAGLLHAVTKSAYDSAVYEMHLAVDKNLEHFAHKEGYKDIGAKHMVRFLGSRNESAQALPQEGV
jgi:Protein of unknown function (DUF1999)